MPLAEDEIMEYLLLLFVLLLIKAIAGHVLQTYVPALIRVSSKAEKHLGINIFSWKLWLYRANLQSSRHFFLGGGIHYTSESLCSSIQF